MINDHNYTYSLSLKYFELLDCRMKQTKKVCYTKHLPFEFIA